MSQTIIHIPAGGDATIQQVEAIDLNTVSGFVGGHIQGVFLGGGITVYVNEEGLILGLPPNRVFTRFDGNKVNVVGDAILMSSDPATGDDIGLTPEEAEEWLAKVNNMPWIDAPWLRNPQWQ